MIYNRYIVIIPNQIHNIKRVVKKMTKTALRILSAALILIIACSALSGCSETVKNAELRCPLPQEPNSVDPQTAYSNESLTIAANCYESLMKTDENGKFVLAAASDMQVSPDGLAYLFRLRKDSKWHINSNHKEIFGENYETAIDLRVTAHDFVFGFQRALAPETQSPYAQQLFMIKNAEKVNSGKLPVSSLGVRAIDDYTLEIQLEYAGSEFMRMLTEPVTAPCNRAFFEATKGRYGLGAEYVLCNGPFYLSRWYEKSNIVLRSNPDNKASQASIYSVTYAFTQDEKVIIDKLLDGTYAVAPLTAEQVEEAEKKKCNVHEISNGVWGLMFNCADETMQNPKMRLALALATKYDVLRSGVTSMTATATGIVPASCTVEGRSYSEVAPQIGLPAYNAVTAKKYYDECTEESSCHITVLCTAEEEDAMRKVIQDWQQIFGLTLTAGVDVVEADELERRVKTGDYQCALSKITTDAQTAVEFLQSFRGGANVCRFSSQNFDKLLNQLSLAGSPQSVVEGCSAAQSYLVQNAVILPLFYTSRYIASGEKMTGVKILHSGNMVQLTDAELLK